ncbi:MAG: ABC transporter ATP-binding protein [Clostridiales bacterium]|nr:ABC transporter ATP-binding protein [Clostridiales bacterium]
MRKLYSYIKPYIYTLIFAMICKGSASVIDLLLSFLLRSVINEGIAEANVPKIIRLCIAMVIAAVAVISLNIIGHFLSSRTSQGVGENLRNALYARIQQMTIHNVETVTTSSLIMRVTNDVEHVQRALMMMMRFMMRAPIVAIGGTLLSLWIDPVLTLVIFLSMIILTVGSFFVYSQTRKIYQRVQKSLDRMTTILRENLEGIRVIKSFDKSGYEIGRFDEQSREVRKNEVRAGNYNAVMSPSIVLITNITMIVILYISSFRLGLFKIEIGDVITIMTYINMILNAMSALPRMFIMFSRANTSADRIDEILKIRTTTYYGEEESPADTAITLEFSDVTFRYPNGEKPALQNINFKLARGETLAIIGETGSGKTSLLNLILRLYDPTEGEIFFQGRPISSYKKDYLTSKVTAAMQQYNIFGMSIKENIMLNITEYDDRLQKSVKTAQLEEMVDELENGLEYMVAQNGANLSGGQKQRLSIARTLFRNADLVVLDDVSSALDYTTDLRLRRALRKNYRNTSVVLISQRISSVRGADQILVLKNGSMAGLGTHEYLLSNCEVYQKICASQGVEMEVAQ